MTAPTFARFPRRLALALTLLAMAAAAAAADPFPARPVKLLVATAAGGSNDVTARLVAEKLAAAWGQPVLVEQRVGANGMIAAQQLAKAPPDGYTAYLSLSSVVQNTLLRGNPGYKLDQLVPVSMVASIPITLATQANSKITSVAELVSAARTKPDGISYSTSGVGGGSHIIALALSKASGISMVHVPYAGESQALPDLLEGRLGFAIGSAGFFGTQAAAGKARLLAVTGPRRLPLFPDVPTMAEAGYPGANLPGWVGLFLPAGTPEPVVARYSEAVRKALADADVRKRIEELGFLPVGNTRAEFAGYIQSELGAWAGIIRDNNIKLD
jgi:tripartite-type tricarboxylate transporter receptor subunit TctC